MTNKDWLQKIDERLDRIEQQNSAFDQKINHLCTQIGNHLAHHWQITVLALTAAATGFSSLLVGVILYFIKGG